MAGHAAEQNKPEALYPYLSPAAVWALSVGSSVGWGSLVVTSRSYLSQAGPMGSVLGLLIGGALMLLVARNFHYMAYRDSLTGVKSKHAYVEQEQAMAQKLYSGEIGDFGIVVCDVNGLKHINGTLGHKAGDMYIRSASQLICEYFKHSPVFRIGGDEFAVILQGHDFDNRHEILNALNEQIERNLGTGNVVASLGMAEYQPGIDNTFRAVFTRADALMYERKKQLKAMGAKTRD